MVTSGYNRGARSNSRTTTTTTTTTTTLTTATPTNSGSPTSQCFYTRKKRHPEHHGATCVSLSGKGGTQTSNTYTIPIQRGRLSDRNTHQRGNYVLTRLTIPPPRPLLLPCPKRRRQPLTHARRLTAPSATNIPKKHNTTTYQVPHTANMHIISKKKIVLEKKRSEQQIKKK